MGEPRQKISVAEAAKQLNIDARTLRTWMRKGKIDLGVVIPPTESERRHFYCIYRDEFEAFIGRKSTVPPNNIREGRAES